VRSGLRKGQFLLLKLLLAISHLRRRVEAEKGAALL